MIVLHKKKNDSAILVSNLRLKFPGETSLVFKDLSLHIPYGQKVLLLGPSGSGKSTLLQVLSGIIPHSIEVPLKYDALQSPRSWGFVFQDPDSQFCMTHVDEELAFVLENLCIPKEQMEAKIRSVLQQTGLNLDDLHVPIQSLSQGMKQRLALASVLLLQPEVLFLDEPSALLDPAGTKQMWDCVKNAAEQKTVIVVEHKVEHIIEWVDRVVLFNQNGEILADGTPSEIINSYKQQLIDHGIWYPDVWKDYLNSHEFASIAAFLQQKRKLTVDNRSNEPVLFLREFSGLREEKEKIKVENAEVYAADWIAIVGENGAGKSTLLLSLMQLLPTKGTYAIFGKKINCQMKRKSKRKYVPPAGLAFVFQNPEMQFVTNTMFEEVAFSLQHEQLPVAEMDQKVHETLDEFGLHMHHTRHPYQLSIGQKRRLSVASAVVTNKPILLLDEPTFGQDAKNTFAILEKLAKLNKQGTTILMVTHDENIVKNFANKMWRIQEGKLVEQLNFSAAGGKWG